MAERICSIEGCPDKPFRRGWCASHYHRWQRYKDPLLGGPRRDSLPKICSVEDCGTKVLARGYCVKHYAAWSKYGDPLGKWIGPATPRIEKPSYNAAHSRMQRDQGRAAEHPCSECGNPAEDYAYLYGCPDELVDRLQRPYCVHSEHYRPMCKSCHRYYDREHRSAG